MSKTTNAPESKPVEVCKCQCGCPAGECRCQENKCECGCLTPAANQ